MTTDCCQTDDLGCCVKQSHDHSAEGTSLVQIEGCRHNDPCPCEFPEEAA